MKTKTVMLALCEVTKRGDNERVAVTCASYEVPILRKSFGPQQVRVVNPEYDALRVEDNAFAEYRRLCQKYDDKNTGIVAATYVDEEGFAQRSGLTLSLAEADIAEKPLAERSDNEGERQARVAEAKGGGVKAAEAKRGPGRPHKEKAGDAQAQPLGEAAVEA